jgi:hypothetical protein
VFSLRLGGAGQVEEREARRVGVAALGSETLREPGPESARGRGVPRALVVDRCVHQLSRGFVLGRGACEKGALLAASRGRKSQSGLPTRASRAVVARHVLEQRLDQRIVQEVPRERERLTRSADLGEEFEERARRPLPGAFVGVNVVQALDQVPDRAFPVALLRESPRAAQLLVQIDEGREPFVPLDHALTTAPGFARSPTSDRMRSAASACSRPPWSEDSSTTQ